MPKYYVEISRQILVGQKFSHSIVRPVKRDWAVLSKDTHVDIFI